MKFCTIKIFVFDSAYNEYVTVQDQSLWQYKINIFNSTDQSIWQYIWKVYQQMENELRIWSVEENIVLILKKSEDS